MALAPKTVEISCVIGGTIAGRDCPSCRPGQSAAFSGLRIGYPSGRALYVTRPYRVGQVGVTDRVIVSWGSNLVTITLSETSFALIADLVEALNGCNFAVSSTSQSTPAGIFDDDSSAAVGAVPIGGLYELSLTNYYGLPAGTLKIRRE